MEAGRCPKCGSEELIYGDLESSGEDIFYEINCEKCKWYGKEWYSTTFTGFTGENNEDIENMVAKKGGE